MAGADYAESLTLDQLRVLAAIVDTGSFSGASKMLQRSQSAISYQVSTLEEQLQLQLFRRTRRRPELTDAGRSIVSAGRDVLGSVDTLRSRAQGLGAGLEPRVRLAVDVLYPAGALAQHLGAFNEALPTVEVDLRMGVRFEPVRLLTEGQVDVAVGPSPDGFEARQCFEAELITVVARSHPLAAHRGTITDAELARHLHLVLSDDSGDPERGTSPTWRINDSVARRELLLAGVGWCRMPRHQVQDALATEQLVRVRTRRYGNKAVSVPLFVTHQRGRSLGPAAKWWFDRL